MKDEFHRKGNFLSDAIQINLNGPISSLDAVINNEVGKDGKTEWERLLGEPVDHVLDQDTAIKIYEKYEQDLKAYIPQILASTPEKPAVISYGDIVISAFKEHAPDIAQDMEGSLKAFTHEKDIKSTITGNLTSLMIEGLAGNGAAQRIGDKTFLITPAEMTLETHAAHVMGVYTDEVPPHEHMGSEKEWRATDTLHELEHLTDQNFLNFENAPKNIHEIGRNIREIDSVHSSLQLVKPFASEGFPDYYLDARTIGTNYKLVLSLDSSKGIGEKDAMMRHAVSNPLQHIDAIQENTYSLDNYTEDQKNLARKIREELGIHDDTLSITPNRLSLREVTSTVKTLIDEAEASSLCWSCLNDDELELAKDFLKATDDVGFQKSWNKPQQDPALNNGDLELNSRTQDSTFATNGL